MYPRNLILDSTGRPALRAGHPWEAGRNTELTTNLPCLPTLATTEIETYGLLGCLRARSRWLRANNGHAAGVIGYIARRIAGGGLTIRPKIRLPDGEFATEVNADLASLWEEQSEDFCVDGSTAQDFWTLTQETWLTDGEQFSLKALDPEGRPLPRRWQVIDADQLADNLQADQYKGVAPGNRVRLGIEFTPANRPAAYHFYEEGQTIWGTFDDKGQGRRIRRIPAELVRHQFIRLRPGQYRGIPLLTPVLLDFSDLHEYRKAEIVGAWIAATYAAFVKTTMAEERQESRVGLKQTDPDTGESNRRQLERISSGRIEYLGPNEDIVLADPKRPNANFSPFCTAVLRCMSAGHGISYEALARDYSTTNFSSARATMQEDAMTFWSLAARMDATLTEPVYRDFVDGVFFGEGLIPVPAVKRPRDLYSAWIQHPKIGWIDPGKMADAYEKMLKLGITSRTAICAELNLDFEEVVAQLKEEKELLDAIGFAQPAESPASVQQENIAALKAQVGELWDSLEEVRREARQGAMRP